MDSGKLSNANALLGGLLGSSGFLPFSGTAPDPQQLPSLITLTILEELSGSSPELHRLVEKEGLILKRAFSQISEEEKRRIEKKISAGTLQELLTLSRETDPELFFEALIHFGNRMKRDHRDELAGLILNLIQQSPAPAAIQQQAKAELDAMTGVGEIGMRLEYLGSRVAKESLSYKMIIPMTLGTAVGSVMKTGTELRLATFSRGFFTRGFGLKVASNSIALVPETFVFAGSGMGLRHLAGEPIGPVATEFLGAGTTLGFLKIFGGVGNKIFSGLHRTDTMGIPTRLSTLTRFTQPTINQTSQVLAIGAAHKVEEWLNLRVPVDGATFWTDAIIGQVNMGVGGHLGHQALGRGYAKFQQKLHLTHQQLASEQKTETEYHRPGYLKPALTGLAAGTAMLFAPEMAHAAVEGTKSVSEGGLNLVELLSLLGFGTGALGMVRGRGEGERIGASANRRTGEGGGESRSEKEWEIPQFTQRLEVDEETVKALNQFPAKVQATQGDAKTVAFALNHAKWWIGLIQQHAGELGAEAIVEGGKILFGRWQEKAEDQKKVEDDLREIARKARMTMVWDAPGVESWWRPLWERILEGSVQKDIPPLNIRGGQEGLAAIIREVRKEFPEMAEEWLEELAHEDFQFSEKVRELADGDSPSPLELRPASGGGEGQREGYARVKDLAELGNFSEVNDLITTHYQEALRDSDPQQAFLKILELKEAVAQINFKFIHLLTPKASPRSRLPSLHSIQEVEDAFIHRIREISQLTSKWMVSDSSNPNHLASVRLSLDYVIHLFKLIKGEKSSLDHAKAIIESQATGRLKEELRKRAEEMEKGSWEHLDLMDSQEEASRLMAQGKVEDSLKAVDQMIEVFKEQSQSNEKLLLHPANIADVLAKLSKIYWQKFTTKTPYRIPHAVLLEKLQLMVERRAAAFQGRIASHWREFVLYSAINAFALQKRGQKKEAEEFFASVQSFLEAKKDEIISETGTINYEQLVYEVTDLQKGTWILPPHSVPEMRDAEKILLETGDLEAALKILNTSYPSAEDARAMAHLAKILSDSSNYISKPAFEAVGTLTPKRIVQIKGILEEYSQRQNELSRNPGQNTKWDHEALGMALQAYIAEKVGNEERAREYWKNLSTVLSNLPRLVTSKTLQEIESIKRGDWILDPTRVPRIEEAMGLLESGMDIPAALERLGVEGGSVEKISALAHLVKLMAENSRVPATVISGAAVLSDAAPRLFNLAKRISDQILQLSVSKERMLGWGYLGWALDQLGELNTLIGVACAEAAMHQIPNVDGVLEILMKLDSKEFVPLQDLTSGAVTLYELAQGGRLDAALDLISRDDFAPAEKRAQYFAMLVKVIKDSEFALQTSTISSPPPSPRSFTLEKGKVFTIGRNPGNDLVIEGQNISQQHAELSVHEENGVQVIKVEDKGSSSGIIVHKDDSHLPSHQLHTLEPGDGITIGDINVYNLTDPQKHHAKVVLIEGYPGYWALANVSQRRAYDYETYEYSIKKLSETLSATEPEQMISVTGATAYGHLAFALKAFGAEVESDRLFTQAENVPLHGSSKTEHQELKQVLSTLKQGKLEIDWKQPSFLLNLVHHFLQEGDWEAAIWLVKNSSSHFADRAQALAYMAQYITQRHWVKSPSTMNPVTGGSGIIVDDSHSPMAIQALAELAHGGNKEAEQHLGSVPAVSSRSNFFNRFQEILYDAQVELNKESQHFSYLPWVFLPRLGALLKIQRTMDLTEEAKKTEEKIEEIYRKNGGTINVLQDKSKYLDKSGFLDYDPSKDLEKIWSTVLPVEEFLGKGDYEGALSYLQQQQQIDSKHRLGLLSYLLVRVKEAGKLEELVGVPTTPKHATYAEEIQHHYEEAKYAILSLGDHAFAPAKMGYLADLLYFAKQAGKLEELIGKPEEPVAPPRWSHAAKFQTLYEKSKEAIHRLKDKVRRDFLDNGEVDIAEVERVIDSMVHMAFVQEWLGQSVEADKTFQEASDLTNLIHSNKLKEDLKALIAEKRSKPPDYQDILASFAEGLSNDTFPYIGNSKHPEVMMEDLAALLYAAEKTGKLDQLVGKVEARPNFFNQFHGILSDAQININQGFSGGYEYLHLPGLGAALKIQRTLGLAEEAKKTEEQIAEIYREHEDFLKTDSSMAIGKIIDYDPFPDVDNIWSERSGVDQLLFKEDIEGALSYINRQGHNTNKDKLILLSYLLVRAEEVGKLSQFMPVEEMIDPSPSAGGGQARGEGNLIPSIKQIPRNYFDQLPTRDINTIPEEYRHLIPKPKNISMFSRFERMLNEAAFLIMAPDRIAIRYFGPPGTSKTTIPEMIAGKMGIPLLRFPYSKRTDASDVEGTWKLEMVEGEEKPVPVYKEGPYTVAMEHGFHVVSDEPDLARPSVLAANNNKTAPGEYAWVRKKNGGLVKIKVHRDYRHYSTENGVQEIGREEHGDDFLRRSVSYYVGPWDKEEVSKVLTDLYENHGGQKRWDHKTTELLAYFHDKMRVLAAGLEDSETKQTMPPLGSGVGQQIQFTPRSALRLAYRLVASGPLTAESLSRAIRSEYILPLADKTDRELVWRQANAIFRPVAEKLGWKKDPKGAYTGPHLIKTPTLEELSEKYLGGRKIPKGDFVWTGQALRLADEILWNFSLGIDVMMLGGAGEGKTEIPPQIAKLLQLEYYQKTQSSETDEEDLVGGLGRVNGRFDFIPDVVALATMNGGVGHLDEALLADTGKIESVMNPLQDGARALILKNPYQVIPRHKNALGVEETHFIATSNDALGGFGERQEQSGAAMSRWAVMYLIDDFAMQEGDRLEIMKAWLGRPVPGKKKVLVETPHRGVSTIDDENGSERQLISPLQRHTFRSDHQAAPDEPIVFTIHPEIRELVKLPEKIILDFKKKQVFEVGEDGVQVPLSKSTQVAINKYAERLTRQTKYEMAPITGRVFQILFGLFQGHVTSLQSKKIYLDMAEFLEKPLDYALGAGKHEWAHAVIDRPSDKYDAREVGRLYANVVGDPRMNEYVGSLREDFREQIDVMNQFLWPETLTEEQMQIVQRKLPHEDFADAIIYYWRHGKIGPWITNPKVLEALEKALPILEKAFKLFPESTKDADVEAAAAEFYRILDEAYPFYEELLPESEKEIMRRLENGEKPEDLMNPFGVIRIVPMPGGEEKGEGGGEKGEGMGEVGGNGETEKRGNGETEVTRQEGERGEDDTVETLHATSLQPAVESQDGAESEPTKQDFQQMAKQILESRAEKLADQLEPHDPGAFQKRKEQIAAAKAKVEASEKTETEQEAEAEQNQSLSDEELKNIQAERQKVLREAVEGDLYRSMVPAKAIHAAQRLKRIFPPQNPAYLDPIFMTGKKLSRKHAVKDTVDPASDGKMMLRRTQPGERSVNLIKISDVTGSIKNAGAMPNVLKGSATATYLSEQLGFDYGEVLLGATAKLAKPLGKPLNSYRKKNELLNIIQQASNDYDFTSDTNIREPLAKAIEMIKAHKAKSNYIVLITDGGEGVMSYPRTVEQLEEAAEKEGIHLLVLAMGDAKDIIHLVFKKANEKGMIRFAADDGSDIPDQLIELFTTAHQRRFRP